MVGLASALDRLRPLRPARAQRRRLNVREIVVHLRKPTAVCVGEKEKSALLNIMCRRGRLLRHIVLTALLAHAAARFGPPPLSHT